MREEINATPYDLFLFNGIEFALYEGEGMLWITIESLTEIINSTDRAPIIKCDFIYSSNSLERKFKNTVLENEYAIMMLILETQRKPGDMAHFFFNIFQNYRKRFSMARALCIY